MNLLYTFIIDVQKVSYSIIIGDHVPWITIVIRDNSTFHVKLLRWFGQHSQILGPSRAHPEIRNLRVQLPDLLTWLLS